MHLRMADSRVPYSSHCDLDLCIRIIVSRAYLISFEPGIPNSSVDASWDDNCRVPSVGHCDLDLVARNCIESGAYLLCSLR